MLLSKCVYILQYIALAIICLYLVGLIDLFSHSHIQHSFRPLMINKLIRVTFYTHTYLIVCMHRTAFNIGVTDCSVTSVLKKMWLSLRLEYYPITN